MRSGFGSSLASDQGYGTGNEVDIIVRGKEPSAMALSGGGDKGSVNAPLDL